MFDQVINTIMNVKSKDDINARRDLAAHFKCRRLHIQTTEHEDEGRSEIVPNAPYVMSKKEAKTLCEWLKHLKLLDGYTSNLSLVSILSYLYFSYVVFEYIKTICDRKNMRHLEFSEELKKGRLT